MADETKQEVPEATILRLFAPVDELEWVDVPGFAGARVGISLMSKYAKEQYKAKGQTIHVEDGKLQQRNFEMELHTAEQNLELVLQCVKDWELPIVKQAKNAEGETVTETFRPPSQGRAEERERARRQTLEALYKGKGGMPIKFDLAFADWLVDQCERVNALGHYEGNSSASS